MSNWKSLGHVLVAAAILVPSTIALGASDTTFTITSGSLKVGATTFPIKQGALVGTFLGETGTGTGGSCGFLVSAEKTNALFEKIRVSKFPAIDAQLELCNDVQVTFGDTSSGSSVLSAPGIQLRVKVTGAINCEIPCTTVNATSNGNGEGRDYNPADGTVTIVDDQFELPASTCGAFVDRRLGLPSAAGENAAVLTLKAEGAAPSCTH